MTFITIFFRLLYVLSPRCFVFFPQNFRKKLEPFQDAMVISPTLQMPYGPGQPYLLQLILEELSTKPLGRELYLERPGGSSVFQWPC
jgi:ubiquinone biosynthesis protein Coq4